MKRIHPLAGQTQQTVRHGVIRIHYKVELGQVARIPQLFDTVRLHACWHWRCFVFVTKGPIRSVLRVAMGRDSTSVCRMSHKCSRKANMDKGSPLRISRMLRLSTVGCVPPSSRGAHGYGKIRWHEPWLALARRRVKGGTSGTTTRVDACHGRKRIIIVRRLG